MYAVNPHFLVLANSAAAAIYALVFVSAVGAKAAHALRAFQARNAVLADTIRTTVLRDSSWIRCSGIIRGSSDGS